MRVIDAYRVWNGQKRIQPRRYENVARKRPDQVRVNANHALFKQKLEKKLNSYPVYKNHLKVPAQIHREGPPSTSVPDRVPAQHNLQNPTFQKAVQVYQRQMGQSQSSRLLEVFLTNGIPVQSPKGRLSQLERYTRKQRDTQKRELWKTYNRNNMVYVDDERIATRVIGYKAGELISVKI